MYKEKYKECECGEKKWVTSALCKSCSQDGEKNSNWRGDRVGYGQLHKWVKRRLVKPKLCELCKLASPRDLANISQDYKRELSDWEWLCRRCHMKKDGRADKMKEIAKLNTGKRNRNGKDTKHHTENLSARCA